MVGRLVTRRKKLNDIKSEYLSTVSIPLETRQHCDGHNIALVTKKTTLGCAIQVSWVSRSSNEK